MHSSLRTESLKLGTGFDCAPHIQARLREGADTGSRGLGLWVIAVEKATGQPLQCGGPNASKVCNTNRAVEYYGVLLDAF